MINKQKGFGVLEIVVGISIISVFLFIFLDLSRSSVILSRQTQQKVKAAFLMEEGMEAVRSIRDRGWETEIRDNLNYGDDCSPTLYIDYDDVLDEWNFTVSTVVIDEIFERSIVICKVFRDANDDISESGTEDSDTVEVTTSVSWRSYDQTVVTDSTVIYLTNIFQ